MSEAIRRQYERYGPRGFFERRGSEYRNPHEPIIRQLLQQAVPAWHLDLTNVLDLACGSGEVTLGLEQLGAKRIDGIDPFTCEAYRERTGRVAEPIMFEAIAAGALAGRRYSLIVCSFALHLIEASRLPQVALELSRVGDSLVVLTPHKRPIIKPQWGWTQCGELLRERVRARCYRSSWVNVPYAPNKSP
jgi:SAM-dependent methyltransferase